MMTLTYEMPADEARVLVVGLRAAGYRAVVPQRRRGAATYQVNVVDVDEGKRADVQFLVRRLAPMAGPVLEWRAATRRDGGSRDVR